MFVAATLALATFPGSPVVAPDISGGGKYGPHFECFVQAVAHGWPFRFLTHDGFYSAGSGLSAWRIGENPTFQPGLLILDVVFLLFLSFLLGWCVYRHIQKHGWRFRMVHLMAVVVCVAAIAAFVSHRSRLHQSQIEQLRHSGYLNIDSAEWQPFGPHCLREWTGPNYWSWGDVLCAAEIEHSDEIAKLGGRESIRVLRITTVRCDAMPSLDDYHSLLAIDMFMVGYDYSNYEGDEDPEFWPCLHVIAQCDSIQGLNLYETGVTDRGLRELARMPNLTHLELSVNPGVTDAGVIELASVKSLRKVGLWGTGVTKDGIERLQAALPNCEIGWD